MPQVLGLLPPKRICRTARRTESLQEMLQSPQRYGFGLITTPSGSDFPNSPPWGEPFPFPHFDPLEVYIGSTTRFGTPRNGKARGGDGSSNHLRSNCNAYSGVPRGGQKIKPLTPKQLLLILKNP